jgi:hypothetical protein
MPLNPCSIVTPSLLHRHSATPKLMPKIQKCSAHSPTVPSSAQAQNSDVMRPTFKVLLNPRSITPPSLLRHTQALTAPAARSISLPAFVPLALPETSKVSFFSTLCPLHAVQRSSACALASATVIASIFSTRAAAS